MTTIHGTTPMTADTSADDHYTALLAEYLGEIDTLDRQRAQLAESRTLAINQLLAHLGVSRKALLAFLTRRKLSDDDRAHYDASLSDLCERSQEPLQADLFDLASAREDATAATHPSPCH